MIEKEYKIKIVIKKINKWYIYFKLNRKIKAIKHNNKSLRKLILIVF